MRKLRYGWAVSHADKRLPLIWGGWFRIYTTKADAQKACAHFEGTVVTKIDLREVKTRVVV